MRNYIGCSGFTYDHWKGSFYPEDLPKKKWLEFYAEHFDTVEINASFYHLPKEKTLDNWYDRVPGNFRFTLKGSRFITHQKKLNDVEEPVKTFYDLASRLKGKLGCILWQLPGNQHKDLQKLRSFCDTLSSDFKNVIEFRHNSWFDEEVYEILHDYQIICSILSAPGGLSEEAIETADTAYIRFHGKTSWYKYNYSEQELQDWVQRLRKLKVRQVYGYFNNDYETYAPRNADRFCQLLS